MPLERLLAGQIVLRKRRPLIRRVGLFADDGDGPRKAELAERDRRLGAAMAGADDQDVMMGGQFGQVLPGPASRSRQRPSTLPGASGRPIRAASVGMMSTVSTDSGCSNGVMPRRQNRIGTRRS